MILFACECGQSLRVRPDLAGRRVRCPRCRTIVTVPTSEDVAPTPVRAATKSSSPRQKSSRGPEDETPRRRTRPAPERARGGAAWLLVAGLALLLVAGGVGGAVWYLTTTEPGKPAATAPGAGRPTEGPIARVTDLDLIPADAVAFATLAPAAWWKGEHGRALQQNLGGFDIGAEVEKVLGVRPELAERVSVVAVRSAEEPLLIVGTAGPCDRRRVASLLAPGARIEPFGPRELHLTPGRCLAFFNDEVFVVGSEAEVRNLALVAPAVSAKSSGPLQPIVARAGQHFLVAGMNFQHPVVRPIQQKLAEMENQPLPPEQAAMLPFVKMLLDADTGQLSFDAADAMTLDLRLAYADATRAAGHLARARTGLDLARKKLEEARGSVPAEAQKEAGPAFDFADGLLRSATLEQEETALRLRLGTESGAVAKLTAALLPAVQKVRMAAARMASSNNLKQIALAFHNLHDVHGRFPPAAISSKDGKPLLSWRVAILPYIEQENLYRAFHLDEPWDSPHNIKLLPMMPKIYAPVAGPPTEPHTTFYRVFTGPDTLFPGPQAQIRFANILDGASNTLLVVEAGEAVPWTKPDELAYDATKPLPKLGGLFPGGFNAALCDGSVRFISETIKEMTLRNLITPADGNSVEGW